ncbi:MAG: DEAD/DEAH box helicase, partial [Deltaproteobacteria bacterium]|nr:DEAD/DEAH box helicase [Deltaproteobacteria bacterium]
MSTYQGRLADLTPEKGRLSLRGPSVPALARLIGQAREKLFVDRTLLVLAPTALEAEDLAFDLRFFAPNLEVALIPPADLKPFLNRTLNTYLAAERLRALYHLAGGERPAVVVASVATALRLAPSPDSLLKKARFLAAGTETEYEGLAAFLATSGYSSVGQVESVGDYSLRGGVLDVYPPGFSRPVRAEFFGDFLESLRAFRVDDQKSVGPLDRVCLLPASEVRLTKEAGAAAALKLADLALEKEWPRDLWQPIADRFRNNIVFDDLENWAWLFHGPGASLASYLGPKAQVVLFEPERIMEKGLETYRRLEEHFARLAEEERPHLPLETVFQGPDGFMKAILGQVAWEVRELGEGGGEGVITLPYEAHADLKALMNAPRRATGLVGPLVARVRALMGRGFKVNLVLRSKEQARRLADLMAEDDLGPSAGPKGQVYKGGELFFKVGQLSGGFVAPFDREAFVAEDEIFGSTRRLRRRAGESVRILKGFASLRDLNPYDFVVHNEHGIGHYMGLVNMVVDGRKGDFLHITYWGGDSLYVPVERFGAVTKYVGSSDHQPKIDRLGTPDWEKIKGRVKESIREKAEELLRLYAARQMAKGFAFSPRDSAMEDFEASFEFDPTPDQSQAIEEVVKDLTAPRPMDRLVCGDVGFGKTEVAVRAAFKVVLDGKQVAILVPTTILAEQHERTFVERLKGWPVNVASLSRFKKLSEQRDVIAKLADGRMDVVIGTHRLLQDDIVFKDLGLLVIDEEHRFGVYDKEKLKKIRAEVDVLSMSATPIPRSLSMSMQGVRDMSIIETPPQDRLAVKTFLIRRDDEAICEAIDRELSRKGQVFFIHNRVRDIGV